MGSYSSDGKYIVFSIFPRDRSQTDKMQLAIMTSDGNKIRKITSTNGPKIYPSFSYTGDKVIFAKGEMRKSGHTPAAGFDIYEVDIKTGEETRLTWFKVFSISPPKEFPDGKTIIFGAYGFPGMSPEIEDTENVFMVKKGDRNLPVPLVRLNGNNPLINEKGGTNNPLISRDGKQILFQGNAQKPDGIHGEGHQYYEYSMGVKYLRLTYLPSSSIWSADLSPDGQYLAAICDLVFDESESKKIFISNIINGHYQEINLPDQSSRIINQNPN
jgi:Tol biopolymer transport system component